MYAKLLQSCPILCNPIAHQAPLSKGILQARILEGVHVPSRGSSRLRDQTQVSYICVGRQVLYHYGTWVARGAARANTGKYSSGFRMGQCEEVGRILRMVRKA